MKNSSGICLDLASERGSTFIAFKSQQSGPGPIAPKKGASETFMFSYVEENQWKNSGGICFDLASERGLTFIAFKSQQ